jgi:HSP20 family protein
MLENFASEMDRVLGDFGLARSWSVPRWDRAWFGSTEGSNVISWAPDIDVYQKDNELIVRADLPGMKKEDVHIDLTENDLTISGERRHEQESERGGVYRSERSYGHFLRAIRLPEGAMTDQAKATFKDGMLEIRIPSPPEHVTRGRRLEIQDAPAGK